MINIRSMLGSQADIRYREQKIEQETRRPVVVMMQNAHEPQGLLEGICECLGITIERISSHDDLAATLRLHNPMAVVAEVDATGQDGCHVLITIAEYDQELPVLMITGDDPILLDAIDAVEEMWRIGAVVKWSRLPGAGELVNFLFLAGRSGNCLRLMPA